MQAALEIAEEEGIKSVSMRKVARRVDAGTMSLYHYVRTKDDLLALMDDAIMGELVIPDGEIPDGWRARLTQIAGLSLKAWMSRPWLLNDDEAFRITENGMRHADQSMGAMEGLDISTPLKSEILAQVDDYVLGFAVRERRIGGEGSVAAPGVEQAFQMIEDGLATGRFPHLAASLDPDRPFREQFAESLEQVYDEHRFDRGLRRLLDGIELELRQIGALPGRPSRSEVEVTGE